MRNEQLVALAVVAAIALLAAGYVVLCVVMAIHATKSARRTDTPGVASADPGPTPFTWLVPAAFAAVMCFTPFAIAALIYASHVATRHRAGDADGARDEARRAQYWLWWSVALGLLIEVAMVSVPWIMAAVFARR